MEAGADTVMDLSTGGDLDLVRRKILDSVTVPVGSVPIYKQRSRRSNLAGSLRRSGEARQGRSGLRDRPRGVNKVSLERLKQDPRIMGVVSRGGSLTMKYIAKTARRTPTTRRTTASWRLPGSTSLP